MRRRLLTGLGLACGAVALAAFALPSFTQEKTDRQPRRGREGAAADAPERETIRGRFVKYEEEWNRIQIRTEDNILQAIPLGGGVRVLRNGSPANLAELDQGARVTVAYGAAPRYGRQGEPEEQEPAEVHGQPASKAALAYPTGDRATSVLYLETSGPESPRVGQPYNYRLRVTNLTRNLTLENVLVAQQLPASVEVVSAQLDGRSLLPGGNDAAPAEQRRGARPQGRGRDDQGQGDAPQGRQREAGQGERPAPASRQAGQGQGDAPQGQGRGGQAALSPAGQAPGTGRGAGPGKWLINRLMPGETKTIQLRLVGHEAGAQATCLRVHYEPTLCLQATFVKPEIEVTKQAPEVADFCDPITFRYTVRNTGTAAARGVTLRDDLPDGLRPAEADGQGKGNILQFDVGELGAGQERTLTAQVLAERAGRFSSRAVATTANDLRAQSRAPTTAVQQVRLAVEVEGPETQYVNRPMTYKVTVRNRGEGAARGTDLRLRVSDPARVLRVAEQEQEQEQARQPDSDGWMHWELGAIRAGESKQVNVTVVGQRRGDVRVTAVATARCAREYEGVTARATERTGILVLPALVLSMVDRTDPVPVGETTIYAIRVHNQGTGPDHNVQIRVTLPKQLEYVGASGTTEASADGQTVTFKPIADFAAGATAEWLLQVRGKSAADVRMRAELTSEYLTTPVPTVEPTRVIR